MEKNVTCSRVWEKVCYQASKDLFVTPMPKPHQVKAEVNTKVNAVIPIILMSRRGKSHISFSTFVKNTLLTPQVS